MIEAAGLQIFRNVGVDEPDLAVAGVRIGFGDRSLALAQRLHLGAGQREARLEALEELVVVPRAAVLGDRLLSHSGPESSVEGRTRVIPDSRRGVASAPSEA